MKPAIYLFFLVVLSALLSCSKKSKKNKYETLSYLEININQDGNLPVVPYTVSLENDVKALSVCGTLHSQTPSDPMFESLEQAFNKVKPQQILTEDRPQYQFYTSHNASIVLDGETGFIRFLGNLSHVKPEYVKFDAKLELTELLNEFTKEEVLVYFVCDRFLSSRQTTSEKVYKEFLNKNLTSLGMVLTDEEQTFAFFEKNYEAILHKKFAIKELSPDDYLPIRNNGRLCEIARFAYKIKDEQLLDKIENLLKKHDRVLVIFSGWHVLSIEPALVKMFNSFNKAK